jgi:hypothetical protein
MATKASSKAEEVPARSTSASAASSSAAMPSHPAIQPSEAPKASRGVKGFRV